MRRVIQAVAFFGGVAIGFYCTYNYVTIHPCYEDGSGVCVKFEVP